MRVISRHKLDSERVRYLCHAERKLYLVKVDSEGRLCWAKNGARITTSPYYVDMAEGVQPYSSTSASTSPSSSGVANPNVEHHHVSRYWNRAKAPSKYIFVADLSFNIYLGIKKTGTFQHSSFLQGTRIKAAGTMEIEDGRLRKPSPLSGHYRPPSRNFRSFIHGLVDEGVDMSRVVISRSYAVLVGREAYAYARRRFARIKRVGALVRTKATKATKAIRGREG